MVVKGLLTAEKIRKKWEREIGSQVGLADLEFQIMTGSIGAREATVESHHQVESLAQLEANLAAVRRRIDAAVAAAGRQAAPPRLIVVTKFHPALDVRRLASLGVTDVGENRDQEAAERRRSFRTLA